MTRKTSKKREAGSVVTATANGGRNRATSVLAQISDSLDQAQAEIDRARAMITQLAASEKAEDTADAVAVMRVRGLLEAGAEEFIPAEVVDRLDAGESPVRVFREWRGMTQGQLADAIDVDQSFISKIEAGTKHPTAANLGRLARALRVDADLLLPEG